jgi:5-methylcytosine-specific restriction protein A
MPSRAARICGHPGCYSLVTAERPCPVHPPRSRWAGRQERGGTAAERGYDYADRKIRAQVGREEPCCRACGSEGSWECDHIVPKSQGGADARSNRQRLCKRCHAAKTAREGREAQR